ncbi:MAG: shikimate kinase [Coriobacteriia bacterium]|nr:shikimate kinase [Coriobacteriia bacterium]
MKHHLALVGVSGAGKSTIARSFAEHAGMLLTDIDAEIVARTKKSIAEFFAVPDGEEHFRAYESQILQETLARTEPTVIALGAGVVLDSRNGQALLQRAVIVHLTVPFETACARITTQRKQGADIRPLAVDADETVLRQRYHERKMAADSIADVTIDTTEKSVERICEELDGVFPA